MTNSSTSAKREWWKDHTDPASRRVALDEYRAIQLDQAAAAWRRIVLGALIVVAIPVLIFGLTVV